MPKATENPLERSEIQATNAAPSRDAVSNTNGAPTREQIEIRAYQLYLQRGRGDGLDVQDWLQAESELIEEPEAATSHTKAANA
jgi:hypothetical protein